ncbi:MAG: hypothetical protein ABJJ53_01700 [Sulfitobacter sp.]
MRSVASITLILCLAAPLFAQAVDKPAKTMTAKELARFRQEVSACWVPATEGPAVTMGFSLDRKGQPIAASLRVIGQEGAQKDAVAQAFNSAKRAVLRCGREGYTLPVEKYDQWRDIELTFDPERTTLR